MGCSAGAMSLQEKEQRQQCDIEASVEMKYVEYSISLEKGADDTLGMRVGCLANNGGLKVLGVDGPVRSYNLSNPETPILFADMFVGVNGQTCARAMLKEMTSSSGMMTLKIRRPRYCLVTITKLHPSTGSGLACTTSQCGRMLIIEASSDKISMQSKQHRVRPGDLVRKVNDIQGDAEAMLAELEKNETLTLEVWRQATWRLEVLNGADTSVAPKECAICMSTCEPVALRRLPCGHEFCITCISNWLANHSTCPYCRCSVDVR
eukprot:TRINITY_DN5959_c0_g1_i1.p1 TRINITY_DN5959_c0_g1~~TRINITY_DN5959_c0_g1_i1.p1  ORF type:complete len:264 (+),score=38.51 TRINITY_DN5959_c0_g1_i1:112-903(+)